MEGINIKRLIETACYFNKVSIKKYYSTSTKLNVVDTRAIVCNILINEYNLNKEETSQLMGRCLDSVKSYIKIHKQYEVINHYTRLYQNTLEHYKMDFESEHQEHHLKIQKTKYDMELETKVERLLNEVSYLQFLLEKKKKVY
jgi:hypothetical protein|tara:strand:+ start:1911 stop:2339 length:429 start_codon:yes stop_codon:yes gene_type:complete